MKTKMSHKPVARKIFLPTILGSLMLAIAFHLNVLLFLQSPSMIPSNQQQQQQQQHDETKIILPDTTSFTNNQEQPQSTTTSSLSASDCPLYDDTCLHQIAQTLSRIWEPHPWQTWCYNTAKGGGRGGGLLLIKVPKSASSTLAGIVLRIQQRHNCTTPFSWKHQLARQHAAAAASSSTDHKNNNNDNNNNDQSMMIRIAPIRDPTSRALSSIFFHQVSFHPHRRRRRYDEDKQNKKNDSHQLIISDDFLRDQLQRIPHNYILDYTIPSEMILHNDNHTNNTNTTWQLIVQAVQQVVAHYHFLLVTDRLDESLVVWSYLTGLSLADVLTVSSKRGGSWYLSGNADHNKRQRKQQKCIALIPPVTSRAIQNFTATRQWKHAHAGDRLLHTVASYSLNRTIDVTMGRTLLEQRVQTLRKLRQDVERACQDEIIFPCSAEGKPQLEKANCYVRDFGCGYPCIDRYLEKNNNTLPIS